MPAPSSRRARKSLERLRPTAAACRRRAPARRRNGLLSASRAASTASAVPRCCSCTKTFASGATGDSFGTRCVHAGTDDDRQRVGADRLRDGEHVAQHRAAADLMQHLRQRGLHARALTGGQNDNEQGAAAHQALVLSWMTMARVRGLHGRADARNRSTGNTEATSIPGVGTAPTRRPQLVSSLCICHLHILWLRQAHAGTNTHAISNVLPLASSAVHRRCIARPSGCVAPCARLNDCSAA